MKIANIILHTHCSAPNATDETVVLTADDSDDTEEEIVDTSQMQTQDILNLRGQDPFMYHSIVQHRRRSTLTLENDKRTSLRRFSSICDYDDDDLGVIPKQEECPPISSMARDIQKLLLEDLDLGADDDEEGPTPSREKERLVSIVEPEEQEPSSRRSSLTRPFYSMREIPSVPLPRRQQRRLSNSFACFTTHIVTRQRRVTTEGHASLVLSEPDVLASLKDSEMMASVSTMNYESISTLKFDEGDDVCSDEFSSIFDD